MEQRGAGEGGGRARIVFLGDDASGKGTPRLGNIRTLLGQESRQKVHLNFKVADEATICRSLGLSLSLSRA